MTFLLIETEWWCRRQSNGDIEMFDLKKIIYVFLFAEVQLVHVKVGPSVCGKKSM